ncbi:MAG TPA: hypothetical protein VFS40_04340 [Gemmatimonadales bacterium]|nr:hypothetical protein [Gemmatimonadales bacterium]
MTALGRRPVPLAVALTAVLAACGRPASRAAPAREAAAPAPLVAGDTAYLVVADTLVPEAIARAGPRLFLGSIAQRRVYLADATAGTSQARPWSPELGGPVLGLEVDSVRGWLWAAVMRPAGRGAGAIVALRLADGTVARRVALPPGAHLPNDLALRADGVLFVTDTDGGGVWSLAPGDTALRLAVPAADGWREPNGIALGPDGVLYVAYAEGIRAGVPESEPLAPLRGPATLELGGIDGLYRAADGLVGIQRVGDVDQVVHVRLARDQRTVSRVTVLERRHPAYTAPTTGLVTGDTLLYLANSQIPGWKQRAAVGDTTVVLRVILAD